MKPKDVDIPHPDKVLFPDDGITKKDLADYFCRIGEHMLPHIKGRPLTLRSYFDGIGQKGIFLKHAPDHFPDFIERLKVPMRSKGGKDMKMVTADEAADLVYFAGQDAVELHMGLATKGRLEKPDQIILDFDPPDGGFDKVREAAFALKKILDNRDLPAFLKTTGSKGVHVHIPIRPKRKFKTVKEKAKKLAALVCENCPDLATMEQRKEKRGKKVFIDWLRNDFGMTAIAPYSPRGKKGAPLAIPLHWEELKDKSLGPQSYNLGNVFRRLSQKEDPWKTFTRRRVNLPDL